MKRFLLLVFTACAIVACSDEDEPRIPVTEIRLDVEQASLVVGETLRLTVALVPEQTTDRVKWHSDDTSLATVSDSGVVTALAAGNVQIKALCGGKSAACSLRIVAHESDLYQTVSFEKSEEMIDAAGMPVELRDVTIVGAWAGGDFSHVFCGKEYMMEEDFNGAFFDGLLFTTADTKIGFGSYFSDNSLNGSMDTWGGFVLSQNFSTRDNGGLSDYKKDGFSAWTSAAANGSATFALAYDNGYGVYDYHTPKIEFGEPRKVAYLYMANATVTAQYKPGIKDYWFKVSITGFHGGKEVAQIEQTLIQGDSIADDWVKVDCSALGEVDELRFKVLSNDMSGIYLNCPAYFCIDELALEQL